jgi:hypothetical protein
MGYAEWYLKDTVPKLIETVNAKFAEAKAAGQTYTRNSIAQQKIVEARRWAGSLPITKGNFDRVLTELDCFYVPKQLLPGPMIVFPMRDIYGVPTRAQTKPFEGSIMAGSGKYMYLGLKSKEFAGPSWLGTDPGTLKRIIEQKRAVLVEGAFDMLANRLLAPDIPTICPLTKTLGREHQLYLRMLGVETIYLMFDEDKPKEGYDIGGGLLSSRILQRDAKDMTVEILRCPSSDPSKALELFVKATQLQRLLLGLR